MMILVCDPCDHIKKQQQISQVLLDKFGNTTKQKETISNLEYTKQASLKG